MVVSIRIIIRNKRLLSLLESQFPKGTELGIEFFESISSSNLEIERYILYTRQKGDNWHRDRFSIMRKRRSGRIREYCLEEGLVYIDQ